MKTSIKTIMTLAAVTTAAMTLAASRPNFIVILTDDLGYGDFACYGATGIKTPNIDRMADEGTKFESFYVSSVCSPTRASFLTGCYPQRVGIGGVFFPRNAGNGLDPSEITLAEILKDQGYATALIGKWHIGYMLDRTPINQGFDYWYGTIASNNTGMDFSRYPIAANCIFREGATAKDVASGKGLPCSLFRNSELVEVPADQQYFTKRYTEEAIRFITRNKDKPFFLYLAHNMPHIPQHVSEAFEGSSEYGLYGDVIQELDWGIGEVLKALQEQGLDENTFVILTSDNGPKKEAGGRSGPLRGAKGDTFEGGQRVPCIMRWPGKVPVGVVNGEPIAIFDFLPTLVKLAGGGVPTDRIIDGKDVWPVIAGAGKVKTPHDGYYYLRGRNFRGIRVDNWKLHYSDPPKDKSKKQIELTAEEKKLPRAQRKALVKERSRKLNPKKEPVLSLYNLQEDIGEEHNVIAEHPEVAQRLGDMMKSFEEEFRRNIRQPSMEE